MNSFISKTRCVSYAVLLDLSNPVDWYSIATF